MHHDKFSQGGDALSPSFLALSGQSSHAPSSPIPDLALGRNAAPTTLASPSFAHQQLLSVHQQHPYSATGRASPGPLYPSGGQLPSESFYPHRFMGHSTTLHHHQPQNQPTNHNPEYHDFAHTPGAPLYHASQRAAYIRSSIASPPPLPLRPPPPLRSSGESTSLRPGISSPEGAPDHSDGPASTVESSLLAPDPTAGPNQASVMAKPTSRGPNMSNGNRGRIGTDSRRPPAPGTLSLPPSQMFSVNPMSPQMTRGIPITPSMPAFTFHAPMSTPPLHHHLLSPGLGPYSPPITFFNPYLNPAPGAPLHTGGQQDPPMFAGINSASGTSSLQQVSPHHHPGPPGSEYFHVPGSPHASVNYMRPPPLMSATSPLQVPVQSLPEPTDYFSGAFPTKVTPLPPDAPPPRTSSNERMGSTGRGSGGTGPSTIPSSSGTSSPLESRQEPATSRGTSNPGEGDDLLIGSVGVDSPPPGTIEHRILHHDPSIQHGRAKSQSPNDSASSLASGQLVADVDSPMGERRMSWNDFSDLQRSIACMSLEGTREVGKTGEY